MNYYNATSGTTGATTIVQLPLAFVRSGYVNSNLGRILNPGTEGNSWSQTAATDTDAYYLRINSAQAGAIYYYYYYYRYYGRPLRCRTPSFLH